MIITNGKIITWTRPNKILIGFAIHVNGSKIDEIGKQNELMARYPNDEVLDAKGQYVMPGLICAHTHFYGAYSRGLAIPTEAPSAFPEILENLWWALDKSLGEKSVYYSAWVCVIDALKHGTTTLFDHHASPNFIADSLDVIADVVDVSGIRASLCYEVTDRDGLDKAGSGIKENLRFLEKINSGNNFLGRLAGTFGLHASLTLSNDLLEKVRDSLPRQNGIHIHVAEHPIDEYDSLKKCNKRVVDRLNDVELLGDKSIVAHAVHVDAKEIAILAEKGVWVTHQPRSNMNNAVGIGNVESMMRAGVKVCLGNDGFSNTMWDEWKTAYLVHKLVNQDPRRMNGYDLVEMAIYQNSALCENQFGLPIGKVEVGAQADLIFVEYLPYTPVTEENLPWHILFGMHHSMISATIVAGKVIRKNYAFIEIDEESIHAKALEQSHVVWKKYAEQF
jgi:putative selenium metabolism protein SsnA